MITQKRLQELLNYNPDTGDFTWKVRTSNSIKVGDVAGCLDTNGYIRMRVEGSLYLAHRLAWLYETGGWPKCETDHINHIRNDNRIANLREATSQENQRNISISKRNTSGFTGVYWSNARGKWRALIRVDGKLLHLGFFSGINDAAVARKSAENKYGFHPNHGRVL